MEVVDTWNYLSDTKELIGKSNALKNSLPPNATTVEPPVEVPAEEEAVFDETQAEWHMQPLQSVVTATVIKVYSYSADYRIYLGPADAMSDAIPPYCTTVAPTELPTPGYVLVFDEELQEWAQMEDHREETVYSTTDASSTYIRGPGPYPAGTTTLVPAVPYPIWDGAQWVTDEEAQKAAAVEQNTATYMELTQKIAGAQCPLISRQALGHTLSADQLLHLEELRHYAWVLFEFIETADLTLVELDFPVPANGGLLQYPIPLA